jgi:hypothetical protein
LRRPRQRQDNRRNHKAADAISVRKPELITI